jgi:allantoin racemase
LKRIALIGATGFDWWKDDKKKDFVRQNTPEGYELVNYTPRHGTHSVESNTDIAYNSPFILEQIVLANKDRCSAIIIDCACDPVLDASREISNIPVVGSRNSALHLALTLGTRFSIITVQGQSLIQCMKAGVRKEGLESFCASVRSLKMPVLDISKRPKDAQSQLAEVCRSAVEDDGADVVVLGCTGLSHVVDLPKIQKDLGIPVIDPFVVAVKTAVLLVESGFSHSKVAYPTPPKKPVNEPPSLERSFDEILRE